MEWPRLTPTYKTENYKTRHRKEVRNQTINVCGNVAISMLEDLKYLPNTLDDGADLFWKDKINTKIDQLIETIRESL